MSLSYHDQHLAWQQRVNREINAAANSQGLESKPHRVRSSGSKRISRAIDFNQPFVPPASFIGQCTDYRKANVYAEVRGKYARPIPQMNNTLADKLAPKHNAIVSRPSTVGNYKKTRHHVKKATKVADDVSVASKRSLPFEKAEETQQYYDKVSEKESVKSYSQKMPEQSPNAEIYPEEEPLEPTDDVEKASNVSWITTSSHRQYIQELEDMLKLERIRRIKAEQALNEFSDRKD